MIYNKITTIKILFQKKNKDCFKDQHKALMIFTKKKENTLFFYCGKYRSSAVHTIIILQETQYQKVNIYRG